MPERWNRWRPSRNTSMLWGMLESRSKRRNWKTAVTCQNAATGISNPHSYLPHILGYLLVVLCCLWVVFTQVLCQWEDTSLLLGGSAQKILELWYQGAAKRLSFELHRHPLQVLCVLSGTLLLVRCVTIACCVRFNLHSQEWFLFGQRGFPYLLERTDCSSWVLNRFAELMRARSMCENPTHHSSARSVWDMHVPFTFNDGGSTDKQGRPSRNVSPLPPTPI